MKRPEKLDDIVGQKQSIRMLKILTRASKKQSKPLPHIVFHGGPGLGKTTLALALAKEMQAPIEILNAANTNTFKNLLPYLMRISDKSILFIDEIHRLDTRAQESLYHVMEDNYISFCAAKSNEEIVKVDIPQFTLIGATTELGSLSKPLIDRFKHVCGLHLYAKSDMRQIVNVVLEKLSLKIDNNSIAYLVGISRGTPRIAISILEWLKNYSIANSLSALSHSEVLDSIKLLGFDSEGLTEDDRKYLSFLGRAGSPVGIDTISASVGISKETILNVIEPYLLYRGKISKGIRGREIL